MKDKGVLDARTLALAQEAHQRLVEYYDKLLDNLTVDTSVTVEVEGQAVRFKNTDDFAEWAAEIMAEKVLA